MADNLRAVAAGDLGAGGGGGRARGDGDGGQTRGPKSDRGRRTGAMRDVVEKNLTLGERNARCGPKAKRELSLGAEHREGAALREPSQQHRERASWSRPVHAS